VCFVGRDIVALIIALSGYGSLKEIQIRTVRDYKDAKSSWYCPLAEIGGGWRKLLLGGHLSDVCPEDVWNEILETVSSRSCDIEEIGLPYIRWASLPPHSALQLLIPNPENAQITINKCSKPASVDRWISQIHIQWVDHQAWSCQDNFQGTSQGNERSRT